MTLWAVRVSGIETFRANEGLEIRDASETRDPGGSALTTAHQPALRSGGPCRGTGLVLTRSSRWSRRGCRRHGIHSYRARFGACTAGSRRASRRGRSGTSTQSITLVLIRCSSVGLVHRVRSVVRESSVEGGVGSWRSVCLTPPHEVHRWRGSLECSPLMGMLSGA